MGSHPPEIKSTLGTSNNNRLTKSIISNEEECYEDMITEYEDQGRWSNIPSLPLEKIYSYVKRNDQLNMSLVCRKWYEGFHSPSIWKKFTLDLYELQLSNDTSSVTKFVQEHSCMFRHVEIEGDLVEKKQLLKNVCRYFLEFLQILSRTTQLTTLKFSYFSCGFEEIDTLTYKGICTEIVSFLGSQHHLKRVEFDLCDFGYKDGAQILRTLTSNSWKSLTYVAIRFFLKNEPTKEEEKSYFAKSLPTLADFPNLTTFEAEYSLIFEHMVAPQSNDMQTIKRCQNRGFSKIILHYDQNGIENFRGLTSTDWRFLQKQYPALQVELNFIGYSQPRQEVEFFIVPNMPISRLEFADECDFPIFGISALFDRLVSCKANNHLITLNLELGETIQNMGTTFITFLQACPKLKCLEVIAISSLFSGMDLFLKYLLENPHESLKKIAIEILTTEDPIAYPTLLNIINEYVSLLRMKGLDIKVELHL